MCVSVALYITSIHVISVCECPCSNVIYNICIQQCNTKKHVTKSDLTVALLVHLFVYYSWNTKLCIIQQQVLFKRAEPWKYIKSILKNHNPSEPQAFGRGYSSKKKNYIYIMTTSHALTNNTCLLLFEPTSLIYSISALIRWGNLLVRSRPGNFVHHAEI